MHKQEGRQGKQGLMAGVLATCMALTACGGGGGGGSATSTALTDPGGNPASPPLVTPPVTQGLTEENYIQVAAVSLSNVFFSFGGVSFEGDTRFVDSTGPGGFFLLALLMCESGDVAIDINAPGGFTAMVGDSTALDFDDCVSVDDGQLMVRQNGRFGLELTSLSGSGFGNPFTATTLYNFSNNYTIASLNGAFAGDVFMAEGQFQVETDNNTVMETNIVTAESSLVLTFTTAQGQRIIYQDLVAARETLDASNSTFDTEADYTLGLLTSITNGTFAIDTTTPFFGIGNMFVLDGNDNEDAIFRPMSGVLTITDSNGAVATLTAMSDGVSAEISLDLDGDTVADVSQIVTYQALDDIVDTL